MSNKTTVVYHRADYDGIFCREIAKKFLPDAELIGWDFGDPKIATQEGAAVYVLDLPPECLDWAIPGHSGLSSLIWIDHHKSSIEKWKDETIPGYRIDGVAACRLAWQWFEAWGRYLKQTNPDMRDLKWFCSHYPFPNKQDFIDRKVSEPWAVQLAGEYDIWDHEKSNYDDVRFQFGLDSQFSLNWPLLLEVSLPSEKEANRIVRDGEAAQQCYATRDAEIMRSRSFITEFSGFTFLCLNTARCNSNTFAALDKPETGHSGLLAFYWTGKKWSVSMYHAAHRKDLDLSVIAVKYGGGGHRGACGFQADKLPFLS
jgi:hypothetical protein